MTRDDLTSLLTRTIHPAELEVLAAGQSEYANSQDNAFGNFDRLASMLDISRMAVLLVYLMKHIDGITSYIRGHRSQREDIRGRIKDARAYLAILWAMVEEEGDNEEREAENKYWQHINDRLRQERVIGVCIQPKDNNGRALIRFNLAKVSRKQTSGETCNRNYWTTVEGDINVGDFVKSNGDGSVSAIPALEPSIHLEPSVNLWDTDAQSTAEQISRLEKESAHYHDKLRERDRIVFEGATPWKHNCSSLGGDEIMVYTTVCPYCFAAS